MSEKKEKILIIEDEKTLIDLLKERLANEGYEVVCAYDGEDGYNKINTEKPDLILLDIVMPKMDGYEVLEKLSEAKNETPVIIISNSGQPVEIEKTKKLGAIDHLIKTEFNPQDVIKKIAKYLQSKSEGGLENQEKEETFEPAEPTGGKKLGIKVLLVEDDAFLREICGNKLSKDGYSVYSAIDGEEALKIVNKVKPDIVLLDIILPSIDGFQILNEIRHNEDKETSEIPVIMLSNLGQESDVKKAMDMGANDFLVKAHFTTEEIANKVKKFLEEKNKQ